ncbi:site-specific integrase [Nitrosomonas sp.]|uniref:tyrosine-type recombinase/integrase n=1 Tax=Nitrosomonas sp. TaxID=42353 RepID=UPI0025D1AE0E|nr:site-specific integrase [Nitrosomonas sp.]MBY0485061.1 site-specific integrase [Nitrosomonas sp.]
MASIRKKGSGYEAAVARKGVRKSAMFSTKLAAQMWAAETEKKIIQGDSSGGQYKTVGDLLQRYVSTVSVNKRGARVEMYRVNGMCKYDIAKVQLDELTPFHLAEWRDKRLCVAKTRTMLREWSMLSHAFNIAINEWGWMTENPLKKVTKPKTPQPRNRRFVDDEITRLLMALGYDYNEKPVRSGARVGAAMLFAIETAMRAGEIISLTWGNINIDTRVAHLPMTKNGFSRDVPLSQEAIRIINQVRVDATESVFNLRSSQLDQLFQTAKRRAGIIDLHFHDTRAEAITRLSKKVDILTLARISGHRDLKILQGYYRETAADIAKRL